VRAASDRSIRFVFDDVADEYVAARPDLSVDAVEAAAITLELRRGGRVLDREDIHALVESDAAGGRAELSASGRFDLPWWQIAERRLSYTGLRYARLVASFGGIAAQPEAVRGEIRAEVERLFGDAPLEVVDLVYVVGARVRS
jgi:hypothetical protein